MVNIMRLLRLFLLFFITTLLGACGPSVNESDATLLGLTMNFDGYLNTASTITVYYEDGFDAEGLKEEIERFLQEADVIYSAYSPAAEMYQVNQRASNEVVPISAELTEAIRVSLEYAELSNGLFDPTILPLVLLWDIDGSSWFSKGDVCKERENQLIASGLDPALCPYETAIPSQEEIDAVLPLIDYRLVDLDVENQTVTYLKPGVQLDMGGFSKGYVTFQIDQLLRERGIQHAMINIGSSSQMTIGTRVVMLNSKAEIPRFIPQTESWIIGTKDPFATPDILGRNKPDAIGALRLSNRALSSSGSSQQFFEKDGRRYHHIYDPFTGYPVDNELIVVQVIADDPVGIDPLSTLVYLLGLEEGVRLIESLEGVEAVFVTYDKRIFTTAGFGSYTLFDTDYRLGQYRLTN